MHAEKTMFNIDIINSKLNLKNLLIARATFPLSSIVIGEDNITWQFGLLSLIKVTKLPSLS